MLTGGVEMDEVHRAIHDGGIRRLPYKPWSDDELKVTIRELSATEGSAFTGGSGSTAADKAAEYGVKVVPGVVVDGQLVSCCQTPGPTREELSAAGIGQRL